MIYKWVCTASFLFLVVIVHFTMNGAVQAQTDVLTYRDILSSSAPGALSNHTFQFTLRRDLSAGTLLDFVPPEGFEIIATSTFDIRNVELLVNGSVRSAASVADSTTDGITISSGSPGLIRYQLGGSGTQIAAGSSVEFRIGNHTSNSVQPSISTSTVNVGTSTATTTATTTIPGDDPGIRNATSTGVHRFLMAIDDTTQVTENHFVIFLNEQVTAGPVDTRSPFPAELSDGQPVGDGPDGLLSGVTTAVEVSVRTNKFAYCRYSTEPDTPFGNMSREFDRGTDFWVFHTFTIFNTEPLDEYSFYVRCIDLEGNINEEDYEISFSIAEEATGTENPDGTIDGDGAGDADDEGADSDSNDGQGSGGDGSGTGSQTTPGEQPTAGGGGSGGGGGSAGASGGGSGSPGFESEPTPFESGDARVIVNGLAPPGARVTMLVDGQEFTTENADNSGRYNITVDGIARGVYTFGIYAEDRDGVRSSTFSTSFTVSGARSSSLSNINIPSTIQVDPNPASPEGTVTFSGYTLPDADITIEHEREGSAASRQTFTTTSNSTGFWSYEHTLGQQSGPHRLRVRAEQSEGARTNFSNYERYGVGEEIADTINADLNRNGRVNLVDFSILLFWWETDGGDSDPSADINGDGVVNLVDFSILLFNWTG